MRFILREVRHFLKQPAFWGSVGIVFFCYLFEHRDYFYFYIRGELILYLDVFYLFYMPFEFGLFFYLIPLIAIPPAALSVIDELASGQTRLRLYRTERKKYITKRVFSISIGSMLPMLIGCLLLLAFSMLIGPIKGEVDMGLQTGSSPVFYAMANTCDGFPYIAYVIGQATLSSWLWGMIGALIALVTLNKGATLMYGFMLFWGCDCLCHYLHLELWRPFLLFFTSLSSTIPLWTPWLKTLLLLLFVIGADAFLMNIRYKRL